MALISGASPNITLVPAKLQLHGQIVLVTNSSRARVAVNECFGASPDDRTLDM